MESNRIVLRKSSTQPIRLRVVGDVNLGGGIAKNALNSKNFTPVPAIKAALGEAPLSFFNLECNPVSNVQKFHSRMISPAFLLDHVREEFNIANIANNHITDAGEEAFLDTLLQLEKRDFLIIGGGRNGEEARKLRTIQVQDTTVGFLACADFVTAPHRKGNHAGPAKPGVLIYQPKKIIKLIRENHRHVDILVCSLHTGLEFHHYPDPVLMKDARKMIDAGAHIILIHHAHVRQGIEIYNNGLIAYGLGNFVFNIKTPYMQQKNASTDIGLLLDIFSDKQGVIGYEFWLSKINLDGKTILLSDVKKHAQLYQEQLVFDEKLSNSIFIKREWEKVCKKYLKSRCYALYGAFKKKEYSRFLDLLWDLRRRENRRWIMGLLNR